MSTEVYYFSGTGNSLAVAREVAAGTGGSIRSISRAVGRPPVSSQAEAIGIVFPCYLAHLHGIPLIVERFVESLEDIGSKYLFAVCTCGGYEPVNALPTLVRLDRLVGAAGGRLRALFSIRLPMNNMDYEHIPVPIDRDQEAMFERCRTAVQAVCRCVSGRESHRLGLGKRLLNTLLAPMFRMMRGVCLSALRHCAQEPEDSPLGFRELIPLTDRSISVDERCNGCGTCVRVCPAHNIELVGRRPVWQHHCEMCFACDEWCPAHAVHHWGKTEGKDYHHPAVTLSDMVSQSRRAEEVVRAGRGTRGLLAPVVAVRAVHRRAR